MSDKTIYKIGGTNIGGSNIEEIESRGYRKQLKVFKINILNFKRYGLSGLRMELS